jgi:sulfur carrier protein ThiS
MLFKNKQCKKRKMDATIKPSKTQRNKKPNTIQIFEDRVEEVKIKLNEEEFKKVPSILKEAGFIEKVTLDEEDLVVIKNEKVIKIRSFEVGGKRFIGFIDGELVARMETNNANVYYSEIYNENPDAKIVKIKKKRAYFENEGLKALLDEKVTIKVNEEEKNLGNFLEISYPVEEKEKYKDLVENLKERIKKEINNAEVIQKHYYEMALENEKGFKSFNKIRD